MKKFIKFFEKMPFTINKKLCLKLIFNISKKLSITPGLRYEYINTSSNGNYRIEYPDLAGNIIFDTIIY